MYHAKHGKCESNKADAIHDSLGSYETTDRGREGASDQSENAERPADIDLQALISGEALGKRSREGSPKVA